MHARCCDAPFKCTVRLPSCQVALVTEKTTRCAQQLRARFYKTVLVKYIVYSTHALVQTEAHTGNGPGAEDTCSPRSSLPIWHIHVDQAMSSHLV